MTAFEIPLSPQAQTFSLGSGSRTYYLRVTWNEVSACWLLDIADWQQVPMVQGIPLVVGVDLLSQYEHLGIGGALVAQVDSDAGAIPGYADLGKTAHLFFVRVP